MVGEKGAVTPRALVVGVVAAVVVVVGVAAFLLRGNGSDGAAPVGTPASPDVSTTALTPSVPAPTPRLPTMPAKASRQSRAGAEAFFRHFFDLYNYGFEALDSQPLLAVSDAACKFCAGVDGSITDARESGERFVGGDIEVSALASIEQESGNAFIVTALLKQAAITTMAADGSVKGETPAKVANFEARLIWIDGGWKMRAGRTFTP